MGARARIEYELKGKTLTVYMYLLKHGKASGSSEIQNRLGLSSAGLAAYHLEKLMGLGLVVRDEAGGYVLVRKVDVGILSQFVQLRQLTLPRLGFYASFFTVLTLLYLLQGANEVNIYGLVLGVGSSLVLWYETLKTWRSRPR